ncbi:MAG: DUF2922 domain-containing protein [Carnobacterium sp.]|uniref:DUF2922 domain-containing protein n=1 Tax=Carnobacterium antarcticum TaxID=2126436 RepID=A0ABW4NJL2_9LACT|nr:MULTISPECIES: DUF2922 domain-containing protein [unclassified Carnobacterium]ALV21489.1 hypothetical protein NY10_874 [Carnobacterium sp. CP1]QQP69487.1 DUF2922 domain-containing protein [Carnobacterium sp. CS13]
MAKTLELRFNTSLGKAKTMSVQDPILDLTSIDAQKAMDDIIALDLFENEGVNLYASVVGARYVERVVEDIFEVE